MSPALATLDLCRNRAKNPRASMRTLLRFAENVDRLNKSVAQIVRWGLLANALLIAANALSRKLFTASSVLAYDLQWHFLAAVVLLMAAYTLQRDQHVRIDLFASSFGKRGLAWLDLIGIGVVLLPVCVAMIWVSWPQFWASFLAGETRFSRESLSTLPAWIIKGFIPLGFALLALQGAAEAIRCIAALRGIIRRPVHRHLLIEERAEGEP